MKHDNKQNELAFNKDNPQNIYHINRYICFQYKEIFLFKQLVSITSKWQTSAVKKPTSCFLLPVRLFWVDVVTL